MYLCRSIKAYPEKVLVVQTVAIDLLKLIDLLMFEQRSHGSFESVNLGGKNVSAAMMVCRGSSGE